MTKSTKAAHRRRVTVEAERWSLYLARSTVTIMERERERELAKHDNITASPR
jgi:hypothetical protein